MSAHIDFEKCVACDDIVNSVWRKRHLVKYHGWRYTDESPNEPQPPKEVSNAISTT